MERRMPQTRAPIPPLPAWKNSYENSMSMEHPERGFHIVAASWPLDRNLGPQYIIFAWVPPLSNFTLFTQMLQRLWGLPWAQGPVQLFPLSPTLISSVDNSMVAALSFSVSPHQIYLMWDTCALDLEKIIKLLEWFRLNFQSGLKLITTVCAQKHWLTCTRYFSM